MLDFTTPVDSHPHVMLGEGFHLTPSKLRSNPITPQAAATATATKPTNLNLSPASSFASSPASTPAHSPTHSFVTLPTASAVSFAHSRYSPAARFQDCYFPTCSLGTPITTLKGLSCVAFIGDLVRYDGEFAKAYERSRLLCEDADAKSGKPIMETEVDNPVRVWQTWEDFCADDHLVKAQYIAFHPSGAIASLQPRNVVFACGELDQLPEHELKLLVVKSPAFFDLLVHHSPFAEDPIPIYADSLTFNSLIYLLIREADEKNPDPFRMSRRIPKWVDGISREDYRHMYRVARGFGIQGTLDQVQQYWKIHDPAHAIEAAKIAAAPGWDDNDREDRVAVGSAKWCMIICTLLFALSGGCFGDFLVLRSTKLYKPKSFQHHQ